MSFAGDAITWLLCMGLFSPLYAKWPVRGDDKVAADRLTQRRIEALRPKGRKL